MGWSDDGMVAKALFLPATDPDLILSTPYSPCPPGMIPEAWEVSGVAQKTRGGGERDEKKCGQNSGD